MVLVLVVLLAPGPGQAKSPISTRTEVDGNTQPDDWRTSPIVPRYRGSVGRHVRTIVRRGHQKGLHRDVVAKIGDSITASDAFLTPLACTEPVWGGWARLKTTVRYFGREPVIGDTDAACGVVNSFSRASTAAVRGWTTLDALRPRDPPPPECGPRAAVRCELRLIKPSVALIMFGTNDVERSGQRRFRQHLAHIARIVEAEGVVPVISTIPPRLGRDYLDAKTERFDKVIVEVAENRRLPLWNYWRQMSSPGVPRHGIGPDGVHPSICATCSAINFTPAGLHQGYALRNLGALRVLDGLRRQILEHGKKSQRL